MNREEKMRTKKILPLLVEFSIPSMVGMIVNAIYNIVDRMFIGNTAGLGSLGLAGVSVCYPVTLVLMSVSLMISHGGSTLFSIHLGRGDKEKAGKFMGNAVTFTILCGFIFTIFGLVFIDPLLRVLGASEKVFPYAKEYLSIILFGAVFQCVSQAGNNFSRAQGNPRNAMISQVLGATFNIIFDYLFIIVLHLGMKGAALATIGGQCLSALWQLAFLLSKRPLIPLSRQLLGIQIPNILKVLSTGIPTFFMQMSNSILNIILNTTLLKYGGDLALSAIGIVTSVQTLIFMPMTGLMLGQQPIISFNFGAKQIGRVKETLKYAIIGGTCIGTLGFICTQLFTSQIVYMFNKESDVVTLCTNIFHIWFLMLPVVGCQIMSANCFQAVGRIKTASVLNLLRQIILLIPLILILSHIFGLYGIFYAVPLADGISFIITTLLITRAYKKDFIY